MLLVVALVIGASPAVAAQEPHASPTIVLDRNAAKVGETVLVTIQGFEAKSVTLTICGNQARRRSADCNLPNSEGQRLSETDPATVAALPVVAPGPTCPCVVVASTSGFDQVAMAPIEILGHPVGPVVGPLPVDALDIDVTAERSSPGIVPGLRAMLGGPTTYEVRVAVTSRVAEPIESVVLTGTVGRSGRDVATLPLPVMGSLQPGETWQDTVRVEVPAPVIGNLTWEVHALGTGLNASSTSSMSAVPWLLVVLVGILLVDVAAIVARRWSGRHQRRVGGSGAASPLPVGAG